MRCLFHIFADSSQDRLEQSHLLILACLNFDYRVDIVFHDHSERVLSRQPQLYKKWQALQLYGAQEFIQLSELSCSEADNLLTQLTDQADFIA